MGSIPKFHSKARAEAEARATAARQERDRAESFLEELDGLLDLADPEPSAA